MAGKLAPDVDATALFDWSLSYLDVVRTSLVMRMVSDEAFFSKASDDTARLAPLGPEQADLAIAQAQFLRLPEARRKALLNQHTAQAATARMQAANAVEQEGRLRRLNEDIASLRAFLAGEPDGANNPAIGLIAPDGNVEADSQSSAKNAEPLPDDAPINERIDQARLQRDTLRAQILALPEAELRDLAERRQMFAQTGQAIADAEAARKDASAQRLNAEQAALSAGSASVRLVASERARLLEHKEKQAAYRAQLARSTHEPSRILDSALGWRQKVSQLDAENLSRSELRGQADELYRQLVNELQVVRKGLGDSLSESASVNLKEMMPPAPDPAIDENLPGGKDVINLHRTLVSEGQSLGEMRAAQLWERRKAQKEAMVTLNDARLELIGDLSPTVRSEVIGFGPEGIAQVRRELDQITLVTRYNVQSYGVQLKSAARELLRPSPALILSVVEFLLAIIAFRVWRRKGDGILARAEMANILKRPQTVASNIRARVFHYWRQIRTPLDWFIFIEVIRWLLPAPLHLPGVDLAWIIFSWLFGAAVLIRLVDALARGTRRDDPRAALRWKSLRLVGGLIVVAGMILRLTSASVGKGAIYHWVLSACWLLIPPVILLLAHWWRDRIVALSAESAKGNSFLAWNARNPGGITGLIGRVFAGALLLWNGLVRLVAQQVRGITLIREIYGQRDRQRAAKEAAEDLASGRFERLDDDLLKIFAPHRLPPIEQQLADWPGGIAIHEPPPGTLTAIIGNRGVGKSALIRAMERSFPDDARKIVITVGEGRLPAVLNAIQEAFDSKPDKREPSDNLFRLFAENTVETHIALDDVQRLVTPSIGGLADFDRLIDIARRSPPHVRWTMALGRPAWDFLSRARHERLVFDAVIRLPGWSAERIRKMIEARCHEAGIDPDFSDLREEAVFIFDSDMTPDERRKRSYYDRLREYAHGNPAVALEFWTGSLFLEKATGRYLVRPFGTPSAGKITQLPDAALFVLRTIVQMDVASEAAILRSTNLPPVIVDDALRGLRRLGVIKPHMHGYRVVLKWWTEVVGLLERRNLIQSEQDK